MFPCSSRVKLNRVALKDVIGLKAAAPRRRRTPTPLNTATADPQTPEENQIVSEPVSVEDTASVSSNDEPVQTLLTDQTGPDKLTSNIPDEEPVENCISTQKEKRSNHIVSCKGNKSRELKLEGPITRGKYHQSKPNTRRKVRQDCLRELCSLKLRCILCFCTDSHGVQTMLKHAEVHRGVKPRAQIKCSNERLVFEIPTSQKPLDLKSNVGKASGRGKFKQGTVKRKRRATHVAKSGRGRARAGQSTVKARSAGCDPQPAAAHAGQMPTGQPTTLSNVDRNTHPSLTGLAVSEVSLRRVKGFGCSLCGDCRFVAIRRKRLGKQEQKSSSLVPEQPMIEVHLQEAKKVAESSQKIVIWIGKYPQVTLCDVAQNCDALSHDCSFVLPDVLKTKVVHCFKDMRAGFQFGPGCLGHSKHEKEEGAQARKKEFCARLQSEKSVCLSQSLAEHQRHLNERTDAQALSSHTTCRFLKSWTSEGSATCSASFLLGKRAKRGECRTGMWNRGDGEDPGPGSHLMGAEIPTDKRIKLGKSVQDGIFSSTPDLKCVNCKNTAKTDSGDKGKTCFWTSDESQSCSEHAVGIFGSAVEENCVYKKPCGEKESDAAQMSSEPFCERNEVDRDEPESLTCQRVRVYSRKNIFSCARTYMSWPFSNSGQTPETNAGATACAAEHVDPSDNTDSQINQKLQGLPSSRTNQTLPNEPRDSSSDTTYQASHQNAKLEKDGESISTGRNRKRHSNMSSYCSDNTNIEFAPHLMEPDGSLAGLSSDTATLSRPSRRGKEPGTEAASASSLPVNGPQTDSSTSTPSPSALFLSDWETATSLSSMSSPFTQGGLSSPSATPSSLPPSLFLLSKVKSVGVSDSSLTKAVEKPLFYCEETRMTRSSSSCPSPHNSGIFNSCESSLLLPQDEQDSNEALFGERCPPKLEPYYKTSPINYDLLEQESLSQRVLTGKSADAAFSFMHPVMLSPVISPQGRSWPSPLPQRPGCLDEEEEEIKKGTCKMSPGCHMPQIVNTNNENSKDFLEHDIEDLEGVSANFKPWIPRSEPPASPSTSEENDSNGEESQDQTDCEDDVEQGYKQSDQLPSDPKIKATFNSGGLTEPGSSPSSDEEDRIHLSLECSSPSKIHNERDRNKTEAAGDTQQAILDEFTAYENDILLVDVNQEDPELFENLPQESVLKLGPARVTQAPRNRPVAVVKKLLPRTDGAQCEQRLTPVNIDFHCESPDITEENNTRPWRPKCSNTPSKTQNSTWSASEKQTENTGQPDANNNHEGEGQERSHSIQTLNSLYNHIPPLMSVKNGPWITNSANMADFRRQKCNAYCRQYFSESLSCGFKMCRFQHVPVEGDEKFCIETVSRFIKIPMCLQKAGAVFTGYYHNNPPGVYFSMPVLLNLLWALLKASMVSEVFSVLTVSLAHKIVPGHEFLLALFNFVREKGLVGFVPELIQLTSKMASAGLVLSLDCLDTVKNTPELQQTVSPKSLSGNHKLSTSAPFPEYLNLAHAIVEIELCTKQEDWRRMGEVFKSNCPSSQRSTHMEQISGRIAIALLSESKDKLSLPFGTFAETVCQNEGEDSLVRSFLGRIGVSLMLRYHKTHQWAKGRRVVEVLSTSKINYTTLKGLFGNENGASRCYLVTVATELFLLSGCVEGALNTLRENHWFLSSSLWPCEPADLESRTRVLMRLAEKTSHRDALDILCNLPGLKEPNDLIDISRYCPLFNSHLQVCLDRQKLPIATDTVDFMLCKNLAVDQAMLQILLHKLAKQNLWLRAREVFRHSLSVGYYPAVSAPPGFMALIVPCELGEVELALTLEMLITVNPTILHLSETTPSCLSITLKRTQSCESEYLSAGSRLLSAASIPQPKLLIHYKAVNSSQEQVYNLDISSARCWLRHNHLWANEVWAH